ncbi:hypothetical protein [Vreelandella janggokensis]|uniref:hypothetical protein n=1 Tax=Vreelandella janggokensis TaxID=370767 RepID=UPI0028640847|nr:hypothetical protein [Halomonas janggokensis]MDR5886528.1 hypothetical protein [Halomonas janggokensis]
MLNEIFTPIISIVMFSGAVAAALFAWTRIFLHQIPDWKYKKQKNSLHIFENICSTYEKYIEQPDHCTNKAKLEYLTKIYCGYQINHRLVNLAFKSDSAIETLEDLRRLKGEVIYKENKLQKRTKPYKFPDSKAPEKWRWISFTFYLLAVGMFFGSLPLQNIGLISLPVAILLVFGSIVFAWLCYETMQQFLRSKRLERIGALIEKHGSDMLPKD